MTDNRTTPSGLAATDRRGAWHALLSGERRGLGADLARAGLSVLSVLYRAGLAVANLRFRLPGGVRRAPCPVVSVGNLSVGGTGKTPMVAYLARLAVEMGARPLIVSRGYGSPAGEVNEEAGELQRLAPAVPHVRNPDRWQAILDFAAAHPPSRQAALAGEGPCDLAILDDGFQHRRLARDLDIVLVDALRPFGCGAVDFGRVLPRGILREPLSALRRADVAVITRAELVDADGLARTKIALRDCLRPDTPILVAEHRPTGLAMSDGSRREAGWLRGRDIAAACGIGNPEAFRRTLEQLGASLRRFDVFEDHHAYTRADLERLMEGARAAGCETLVTTGKDAVKWSSLLAGVAAPPVAVGAMEVAFQVVEGEEVLRRRLGALLAR